MLEIFQNTHSFVYMCTFRTLYNVLQRVTFLSKNYFHEKFRHRYWQGPKYALILVTFISLNTWMFGYITSFDR